MPSWGSEWIAVVLFGAVLGLDHAAWPSLLLAQPLLAGGVAGWIGGHAEAGLAAGAVVQMLAMASQPVGGAVVAEAWLGGFAAAISVPPDVVLRGSGWLDDPRLAAPAVVGIAAAAFGRQLLVLQRALIGRLAGPVARRLAAGDGDAVVRLQALGIGLHALRGSAAVLVAALVAPRATQALTELGVEAPAGRIALSLAAVALASCAPRAHRWRWVAGGLVAGVVVALWS
jgi:mannose/fructose/N-acetylgalactosamine-specific phosphotransferase system component IIC